jgi:hypothetical protein
MQFKLNSDFQVLINATYYYKSYKNLYGIYSIILKLDNEI